MSLVPSESAPDSKRWDVPAYHRLLNHLGPNKHPGMTLLPFDQLARVVEQHSEQNVSSILAQADGQRYGILDYHTLTWPRTPYLPPTEPSTVLAFAPSDERSASAPSHWREFLLHAGTTADLPYEEVAAVFNLLGVQALRRALVSVSAQRRLYRIALPWGRFRFKKRDGKTSREYLLVPVLTILQAARTVSFRRTVTLTMFLLQNGNDRDHDPLDSLDLAHLCHQSVWLHRRPPLPTLISADGAEQAFAIHGPMRSFLKDHLTGEERSLSELFDVTFRKAIEYLGVQSEGGEDAVKSRIAISRMRSAIFSTALHLACARHWSAWKHLTSMRAEAVAEVIGSLLSVHAGRADRTWLIDGNALRLENMRVTNRFEEDVKQLALYNPISRFLLCIIPQDVPSPGRVSLSFGVSWLDLLATSVCTVKEILRSYRHEIEVRRTALVSEFNRIEQLRNAGPPGAPVVPESDLAVGLSELHADMLRARDEVDVIYGLELVGQQYAAAYARILDMENITRERDRLLREFDFTGEMLRAVAAHQLSRDIASSVSASKEIAKRTNYLSGRIAESTHNTDRMTYFVAAFAFISSIGAIDIFTIIPAQYSNWSRIAYMLVTVLVFILAWYMPEVRKKRRESGARSVAQVTDKSTFPN